MHVTNKNLKELYRELLPFMHKLMLAYAKANLNFSSYFSAVERTYGETHPNKSLTCVHLTKIR